jgi:hypothetical protein
LIGKAELDRLELPSLEQTLEAVISRARTHQEGTGTNKLEVKNSAEVAASSRTKLKIISRGKDREISLYSQLAARNVWKQDSLNNHEVVGTKQFVNSVDAANISGEDLGPGNEENGPKQIVNYVDAANISGKNLGPGNEENGTEQFVNSVDAANISGKDLGPGNEKVGPRNFMNSVDAARIAG